MIVGQFLKTFNPNRRFMNQNSIVKAIRIFSLSMLAVAMFTCVACSSSDPVDSTSSNQTNETTDPKTVTSAKVDAETEDTKPGKWEPEWPMWGGTIERNMVASAGPISIDFDIESGKNVAWMKNLGSQTYGNPIVAGGKVFVGTNNGGGYRADKHPADDDKGVILCFDEKSGDFIWQLTREKLAGTRE